MGKQTREDIGKTDQGRRFASSPPALSEEA